MKPEMNMKKSKTWALPLVTRKVTFDGTDIMRDQFFLFGDYAGTGRVQVTQLRDEITQLLEVKP